MWPGSILFLTGVWFATALGDATWFSQAVPLYAPVIFGIGLLLAWRFGRSRVSAVLVGLALLNYLPGSGSGEATAGSPWEAGGLILLVLIRGLSVLKDHGVFSRLGIVQPLIVAAGVSVGWALLGSGRSWVPSWAWQPILPGGLAPWSGLADATILAGIASLTLTLAMGSRRDHPMEKGLFWVLITILVALAQGAESDGSTFYLMVAGLILHVVVLETSHAMAFRDELTGLPARRSLWRELDSAGRLYAVGMVDILKAAVAKSSDVRLVVSGHAHLSGGESDHCGRAYVINAASHDNDPHEPARMVEIDLEPSGSAKIRPTLLKGPSGTVAVLSGIRAPTAERLDKVGLGTLQALAAADPATVRELVPTIGTPPAILVARARAQIEQRPIAFAPISLPPAPRIYFDIETDIRQRRIWLIGAFLEEEDRVRQFAANSFNEEQGMLVEFADFVRSHPGASFVSFSSNHLDHWLTIRRLRHHRLSPPESISAKHNAYHLLWRSLALPTTTFGLRRSPRAWAISFSILTWTAGGSHGNTSTTYRSAERKSQLG